MTESSHVPTDDPVPIFDAEVSQDDRDAIAQVWHDAVSANDLSSAIKQPQTPAEQAAWSQLWSALWQTLQAGLVPLLDPFRQDRAAPLPRPREGSSHDRP